MTVQRDPTGAAPPAPGFLALVPPALEHHGPSAEIIELKNFRPDSAAMERMQRHAWDHAVAMRDAAIARPSIDNMKLAVDAWREMERLLCGREL